MISPQATKILTDGTSIDMQQLRVQLKRFIMQTAQFTDQEAELLVASVQIITAKKGTFLLKEGQVCQHNYLLVQGCVREFQYKNGEEKTTTIYTEGQSIESLISYQNHTPARHSWECLEDCILTTSSRADTERLNKMVPRTQEVCREKSEEQLGTYQAHMADYMASTPEERYLHIVQNRPDLLDRVPQYYLASYIGVSPETLSRIRARLKAKGRKVKASL
jgi:CRP-like cAMP-binding protein